MQASAPGSGNTWARSVVREGLRAWTGSVYHDPALVPSAVGGLRACTSELLARSVCDFDQPAQRFIVMIPGISYANTGSDDGGGPKATVGLLC